MPFEALNTPFRIRRATEQSVFAAGVIAGLNTLSASIVFFDRAPPSTLLGSDASVLAGARVCMALLAAYLAVRSRRQPSPTLAAVILIWSIVEAVPWIPLALYGHGVTNPRYAPLLWIVVAAAVLGFRGALAQRKLTAAPPPST